MNKNLRKIAKRYTAAKQPRDRLGRFAKKNLLTADNLVNTAGTIGSIAGGAVAGPLGALAGDLGGALAARQAAHTGKAAMTAHDKLRRQQRYQQANKLEKAKQLVQSTLDEMAAQEENLGDELTGDLAGWLIGNASAIGLSLAPTVAKVPMKGAAVAMALTPAIVKLRKHYAQKSKTRR